MHRPQIRLGSVVLLIPLFALTLCVVIQWRRESLLVSERNRLRDQLAKSWDNAEQERAKAFIAEAYAQRQADEAITFKRHVQRLQRELQKVKLDDDGEAARR